MSDQTEQNIFTETKPGEGEGTKDHSAFLKTIVNEKGEQKYGSVEEALKALQHSQDYIPKLKQDAEAKESRLAFLEKELEKVQTLQQTIEQLTQKQNDSSRTTAKIPSEEDIATLVQNTLTRREQAAAQQKNTEEVVTSLRTLYGDKAEEKFNEKAQELGIPVAELNRLVGTSPKAVLKLFGADEKPSKFPMQTGSGFRTEGFKPSAEKTFISRETMPTEIGATDRQMLERFDNARKMVEELHQQGLSTRDISRNPALYFKLFSTGN